MNRTIFLLIIVSSLSMTPALAEALQDDEIDVAVKITGEDVVVDLSLVVSANRQQVWAVLTDFDHMASFVSNLKESKVVATSGLTQKIYQRGAASYGLIDFPFESTREIRLTPYDTIRSHMISGNMRKMEGTTRLVDENGRTRIIFHTDTVPGHWMPPIAGKLFIEHETREQFLEIRNEIVKRKSSSVILNEKPTLTSHASGD